MNLSLRSTPSSSNFVVIALLASSKNKPLNSPDKSFNTPWSSIPFIISRPFSFPMIKSSAPYIGAIWTSPVPASNVTWKPSTTGAILSINTCLYLIPVILSPEKTLSTS